MKRVIKTFILITFIVVILVMGNKVGVVFNKIQAGSENQIESNCKSVNLNGLEKIQGNKKKLCIMKKEENEYIEY